jgi:hypothetical protein
MDNETYQLIALGGIALLGVGAKVYYGVKERNRLNNFADFAKNDFKPKADKLYGTINNFKKVSKNFIKNLEKKVD